jgi:hypothetical protein
MKNNKMLYKWLIITFIILYSATAFVSFYHSITFFNIANTVWLSIILSLVAEIGQASVLFSLLLTKNKNNFLAWTVMFLLTALQIVGNVVSSYKYINVTNSIDFTYFQKSILFWVTNTNDTMFKVIIAWITGGILPVIALSMTALVADNLKLKEEEQQEPTPDVDPVPVEVETPVSAENTEAEPEPEQITEAIPEVKEEIEEETKEEPIKKKATKKPTGKKPAAKKRQQVKTKQLKITPVKDLSEVVKVSKGAELIKTLQNDASIYAMETINNAEISDLTSSESRSEGDSESNVVSTIMKNGVIVDKNYR